MSKHTARKGQKTKAQTQKTHHPKKDGIEKWFPWAVFLLSCLLYANTITHEYTQDDAIVITDNMFTKEGVNGIPGLLRHDTFYGFFKIEGKAKLVAGGRYRPLTPIMFAIEQQIFGDAPWAHHLINVLLYALLCMMIYKLLVLMLHATHGDRSGFYLFVLLATMIYAAHPLHTEAVANIKGRDEIMSMLGAVMALYLSLRYVDSRRMLYLAMSGVTFFLGLMSKESTITFLAVIPLSVYFFRSVRWRDAWAPTAVTLGATVIFLMIRSSILGMDFGGTPMELMNNPYLKIEGNQYVPFAGSEKVATITYTLGKYIQLLVYPHPLTHDYYPRHISIMQLTDWQVLLSAVVYTLLLVIAVRGWKKKSIISYSIWYYLITLSIVSNVVFPIGTNMSERFMFMPSLGYAIMLSYTVYYGSTFIKPKVGVYLLAAVIALMSVKTITRNMVWKDDFTLFTTDVHTSANSAKMLNAAGGALVTESAKQSDINTRDEMLNRAIPYLEKALTIHPNYKNAALLLGNAYFYRSDFEQAIKAYERALSISPGYEDAERNLAIAYRDAGRYAGEKENDLKKAKRYLKQSLSLKDDDVDTYRLLGVTHGMSGEHVEAIKYFTKVTEMQPESAAAFVNLGKAYEYYGDDETSRIMFQKAISIDPKALDGQR